MRQTGVRCSSCGRPFDYEATLAVLERALKSRDEEVAHLVGELEKAKEDGHTMYQRGVNVGRRGAAGGRQP